MSEYDLSDVYSQVRNLILESLDREGAKCELSTSLIRDLGAESLDYLDIAFRIERTFGAKVQRGRVEKQLRARLPHLSVKPNTDVTPELKAVLKELMPEIPHARIDALAKVKEIASVFTVATFVRVAVESILESRPQVRFRASRIEGYEPNQLGLNAVQADQTAPQQM